MTSDVIAGREPVPGRPDWLRLVLASGASMEIPLRSWTDRGLQIGQVIGPEDILSLQHDAERASVRTAALGYLRLSDRTVEEMRRYLRRNGYADGVVEEVLVELAEAGILDDMRLARQYCETQQWRLSRQEMRWRLRKRGVSQEAVDRALAQAAQSAQAEDDAGGHRVSPEYQAAWAAACKYWRTHASVEPAKRAERMAAWMFRRGFPAGLIRQIMDEMRRQPHS